MGVLMMATMSLMGLLTYDPELLNENFNLPKSLLNIKTKLLEHIVFECAEMEIVLSDPIWFGRVLDAWSYIMSPQWEYFLKWKLAQDEITTEDAKGGRKLTKKSTRTPELTTRTTNTTSNEEQGGSTVSNSAYNQSTYSPSEQREYDSIQDISNDGTVRYTGSESYQYEENENVVFDIEDIDKILKNGYVNIANIICTDFKERFCLMVY
jgi:hypothetical protein